MATAVDVAAYVLQNVSPITAMKLQKLVYYSQAWHLVWESRPLFADRIEAWPNGPVAPVLYDAHRGEFQVKSGSVGGSPGVLDDGERESIDAVLKFYAGMTAYELSDLTHSEQPWLAARKGYAHGERCNVEITQAAMAEIYESLVGA